MPRRNIQSRVAYCQIGKVRWRKFVNILMEARAKKRQDTATQQMLTKKYRKPK